MWFSGPWIITCRQVSKLASLAHLLAHLSEHLPGHLQTYEMAYTDSMSKIAAWLNEKGYGNILRQDIVSGGCINNSTRLHLDSNKTVFLKENNSAPRDMFSAEQAGLSALAKCEALRIPKVIHCDVDFLLIEDLGESVATDNFWILLGKGLANLHSKPEEKFGFSVDNYCGSTAQPNTPCDDGYDFFAKYRILNLTAIAYDQNLIELEDLNALENIAANLKRWIPAQPPVLIHGDLWSGNIHCCEDGSPALIDPAAYWGWAEAELAMTQLFGGFSPLFYESYENNSGIDKDWQERAALYLSLIHI